MNFKNRQGSTAIIVIIIVIILLGLGYMVFKKTSAPSDGQPKEDSTVMETKVPREEYLNNKFGFKLTLSPAWKGYKVDTRPDQVNAAVAHLQFKVPTTVKNYGDGSGFANPFVLAVYPLADWKKIQTEEGPKPTYIAENKTNVFAYSMWQDAPEDLKNINFDIPAVINSFSLVK